MGALRRTWYRLLAIGQTLERRGSKGLGDLWMARDVTRDFFFHPILHAEFSRARTRAATCFLMKGRLKNSEQLKLDSRHDTNSCYRDFEVLMECMGAPSGAPASIVRGAYGLDLSFLMTVAKRGLRIEPAAFGLWYLVWSDSGERVVVPGEAAKSVDSWIKFLYSPEGAKLQGEASPGP